MSRCVHYCFVQFQRAPGTCQHVGSWKACRWRQVMNCSGSKQLILCTNRLLRLLGFEHYMISLRSFIIYNKKHVWARVALRTPSLPVCELCTRRVGRSVEHKQSWIFAPMFYHIGSTSEYMYIIVKIEHLKQHSFKPIVSTLRTKSKIQFAQNS